MRVTCHACSAPYFIPDAPQDKPRCPNCDAEYDSTARPRVPPPHPALQGEGRSMALTIAGLLHFVFAAFGICFAVGLAKYVGQLGVPGLATREILGLLAIALFVIASGVGVMARWRVAAYTALLVGSVLVLVGGAAVVRQGNLIGGGFWVSTGFYIAATVVYRWSEFE